MSKIDSIKRTRKYKNYYTFIIVFLELLFLIVSVGFKKIIKTQLNFSNSYISLFLILIVFILMVVNYFVIFNVFDKKILKIVNELDDEEIKFYLSELSLNPQIYHQNVDVINIIQNKKEYLKYLNLISYFLMCTFMFVLLSFDELRTSLEYLNINLILQTIHLLIGLFCLLCIIFFLVKLFLTYKKLKNIITNSFNK